MNQVPCKSCGDPMVWLKTAAGKAIPVNAGTVKEGDTLFDPLRHVSHFKTCPDAKLFRRGR